MASGVVVVLGSLLTVPGACTRSVAPVGGVAVAVEVRSVLCWMRRGVEGAIRGLLYPGQGPYRVRRWLPMPVDGPAGEKSTRSRRHSGGAVSDMSAQYYADPHRAGNSGTLIGAGGRDAGHVRCAVWWLTPADVV